MGTTKANSAIVHAGYDCKPGTNMARVNVAGNALFDEWCRDLHVPLKRIGSESEVAAAIVFLLSPGAAFVSGNTIRIDGAASQGSRAFPLLKGKPGQSRAYNGFHRAYLPDVLKDQED